MQMEIFCKVKAPRVFGKVKHELKDVLRMALIGALRSYDDYDEISDLIEDKEDEFKRMGFLKLSNGVPSDDTISKDNQTVLKGLVKTIFSSVSPLSTHMTVEKGHGREEKRSCSVLDARLLEQEGLYEEWPGFKRIIKMDRERLYDGLKSKGTVYYLSSEEKDEAAYFASRIRDRWSIDNKLHWHLDVTFKEDQSRVRTKNGAVNLSIVRKFSMELLKRQTDRLILKRRRKKCMRSLDYLTQVMKES